MTERTAAVERFLEAVPVLRAKGWLLTPFNTWVTEAGVVIIVMRVGGEELGAAVARRLQDPQPALRVRVTTSRTARHVVIRL
jgi:hypothetical protein